MRQELELEIKVNRVHKIENNKFLKAFADIVVNDAILIKGLKIVEKNNALFVSMPAEQAKDKKWYDNVRCLKEEVKEQITERVLEAYHG